MKRSRLAVLLLFFLLTTANADAAVVSRDWKTPGDGLLTYDDVNKREWLDLSQTLLSAQFPGADPSPHITRENRYQHVLSQTGAGGLFEGFTVAKRVDVELLAQSAGINTSFLGDPNAAPALTLAQLLGFTYEGSNGFKVTVGLLDEPLQSHSGTLIRPGSELYAIPNQAGLSISSGHFQYPAAPGVMLFLKVPEPASIALVSFSIISVALLRRMTRFCK